MSEVPAEKAKRQRKSAADLKKEAAALAERLKRVQARAEAREAADKAAEAKKSLRKSQTKAHILLGVAADKLIASGKLPIGPMLEVMSDRDRAWMTDFIAAASAILSRAGLQAPAPGGKPGDDKI